MFESHELMHDPCTLHDKSNKIGKLGVCVEFCDSNKFRWNKTKQMYENGYIKTVGSDTSFN